MSIVLKLASSANSTGETTDTQHLKKNTNNIPAAMWYKLNVSGHMFYGQFLVLVLCVEIVLKFVRTLQLNPVYTYCSLNIRGFVMYKKYRMFISKI
jgi:hypothetical protein